MFCCAVKPPVRQPSLFENMACHLFSAESLTETMLTFSPMDLWEQIIVKFE